MLRFAISAVLASAFLMSAVPAEASIKVKVTRPSFNSGAPSAGYDVSTTWGGGGGGGEFLITVLESDVPVISPFKTFCLEINEHIGIGNTYFASLDNAAYTGGGGASGTPPSDPLSDATKWLYYLYRTDALPAAIQAYDMAYSFLYNDTNSANALQKAIWSLEDEPIGALSSTSLAAKLKAMAEAKGLWDADNGNVLVLNLWNDVDENSPAQSQLYWEPNPPVFEEGDVPEPLSLAIWGAFATIGVVVYRRRSKAA